MEINTISDFRQAVRMRTYTSIGCYPLFFLMADGGTLHPKAVRERSNRREILTALRDKQNGETWYDRGWLPVAIDVNWENAAMFCDASNQKIESAYGED